MRNTFINTLCDMAEDNEDIFLLCGELGFSVLEGFASRFPQRYLNVGIAEQNMTQVAVGLAREGYNVFTYSIGNFATLRCMEQIRYDVCYHRANVKIIAVGAGYAYGPQGVSHHLTEDIAMMRCLPGMLVTAPCDAIEANLVARYMANYCGPGYIRLNKSGEPTVYASPDAVEFSPGFFNEVKQGSGTVVIAAGAIVHAVQKELESVSNNWALWSAPFIGDYDRETLIRTANEFTQIVTVEEHQLNCGFGSSLLEAYADLYANNAISRMPLIKRIGVDGLFLAVAGTQEYLRGIAGLTVLDLI